MPRGPLLAEAALAVDVDALERLCWRTAIWEFGVGADPAGLTALGCAARPSRKGWKEYGESSAAAEFARPVVLLGCQTGEVS